jgi:hypothetical protein
MAMTEARVIGMRMRDHRSFDGLPWVDVEVARGTIEAFGPRDDQVRCACQSPSPWCAMRVRLV